MAKLFNVTYEIVTPESAEHGDAAERGFISEGVTLRSAFADLNATRTNEVDGVEGIEADGWPCISPRWITIHNGMEFRTGATESRSLHIPANVTAASRRRIARYCGVKC